MRQKGGPCLGQGDMVRAALEKPHAQVLLDLTNAGAQGGLGDDHPLGRPAEVAGIGQGGEEAQLAQRYGLGASRWTGSGRGQNLWHGGLQGS